MMLSCAAILLATVSVSGQLSDPIEHIRQHALVDPDSFVRELQRSEFASIARPMKKKTSSDRLSSRPSAGTVYTIQ